MTTRSLKYILAFGVIAFVLGLFVPLSFSQEEEKVLEVQVFLTKKQALEIAFPGADKVKRVKKWLTDEQKESIGEICFQKIEANRMSFYAGMRDGVPIGYALFGHQLGKSYPISYMVVLNLDGTVRDVEILVYREPRGWEVRYPSFMDQFTGTTADTDFRNINTITGATLSVNAMVKGVSRASAAYKVLFLSGNP